MSSHGVDEARLDRAPHAGLGLGREGSSTLAGNGDHSLTASREFVGETERDGARARQPLAERDRREARSRQLALDNGEHVASQ